MSHTPPSTNTPPPQQNRYWWVLAAVAVVVVLYFVFVPTEQAETPTVNGNAGAPVEDGAAPAPGTAPGAAPAN